ncbi:hypothetical protein HN51_040052 [Arachis hypogaea]|uniref:Protein JASON n=1 Tax=Arachis hypogaea TaxID=3818 RepID=A0A444YM31_ARAHY|nr:uncharacterized protein LOC107647830 isoform X2 [Arachis ipaensis]XP_025663293.1 uncharacterized protein LOC112758765 isoform X2 [Arachis hypogaea]QHN85731.1 uncharacterized protein DS421_16g539890 [Arachis hypogaea]RYR02995.1 hypothetical protein Ahy_B06g081834 [Arachis hypogaea]
MGCFIGCFGSTKDARRTRNRRKQGDCSSREQQIVSFLQDHSKSGLSTSSQVKIKPEEQVNLNLNLNTSTRKKVTFDTNVKTYEPVLVDEVDDFQPEKKSEEECGEEEHLEASSQKRSCSEENSSVTLAGSYSTNHRYQNCRDSDEEEDEEMDYWDSDLTDDDDEDGDGGMGEEYDEFGEDFEDGLICSRPRISVNQVFVEEVENPMLNCDSDLKSIGLNPNARDRSGYVHPVLNPVENLSQWKAVKAKRTPPLRSQKENCVSSEESWVGLNAEPSFRDKSKTDPSKKLLSQEIAVDASLSNWLDSSEATPVKKASSVGLYVDTPASSQGSNSVISHEDRPILGALTAEELKQFSVSCLPRKLASRSPDEEAIIGTVGTYWNVMGTSEDTGSATSFKGIAQRACRREGYR